jgi:hypothetical protein
MELDAANGALRLSETKVGAETLVQPAKAGGVRLMRGKARLMGYAAAFESANGIPKVERVGVGNAAFASSSEDLVLAESPGRDVTEAANGLAVDASAIGLSNLQSRGCHECELDGEATATPVTRGMGRADRENKI